MYSLPPYTCKNRKERKATRPLLRLVKHYIQSDVVHKASQICVMSSIPGCLTPINSRLFCPKTKQTLYSWQRETTPMSYQGESDINLWDLASGKHISAINTKTRLIILYTSDCVTHHPSTTEPVSLYFGFTCCKSVTIDFKAPETLVSNHSFSLTFEIYD